MVEASTVPCGLISTTTTFARGLPFKSFTRPVIATVVCGGLSIFSTGEESSVGLAAGAGVASGVAAGVGSGVGEVTDGASGDDAGVGSGVASSDGVGKAGEGCGTTAGLSDEGVDEGLVVGVSAADEDCAPEFSGVAAGVPSGDEVGCTVSPGLSGAGVCALTDVPKPGPIRSSSPSSEPLTFR